MSFTCSHCGSPMKRNGFTSAHHQRYRCTHCNRSHIRRYDDTSWRIRRALNWLVSKNTQEETGISARSLRRDTQLLWQYLPVPCLCEEYYPIIDVDGIHLHQQAVILIAYAQQHVLAWSVARRECAAAYRTLFSSLPAPRVLVCDGGAGIFTAVVAYILSGNTQIFVSEGISKIFLIGEHAPG